MQIVKDLVPTFVVFVIAIVLALPGLYAARSGARITWTKAILLGTTLTASGILLIAEVPSRILYLVSAKNDIWASNYHFLKPVLKGVVLGGTDRYVVFQDVIANTVQGIFFVIIVALIYIWGERQRKAGRFKS
jgi:hypothetical protein